MDDVEGGKFPKEPDEGDRDVIDRDLARQKAAASKVKPGKAGTDREGDLSDEEKSAAIESTKGLP